LKNLAASNVARNEQRLFLRHIMPRPAMKDGQSRSQRYRQLQKARGMKLLRLWVPDPHAPGFNKSAARQAALLSGAPEEQDALDFIESATAEWINDEPA